MLSNQVESGGTKGQSLFCLHGRNYETFAANVDFRFFWQTGNGSLRGKVENHLQSSVNRHCDWLMHYQGIVGLEEWGPQNWPLMDMNKIKIIPNLFELNHHLINGPLFLNNCYIVELFWLQRKSKWQWLQRADSHHADGLKASGQTQSHIWFHLNPIRYF